MPRADDDDEESGHPPAKVSGVAHSRSGGHRSINQIFRDDGGDGDGDDPPYTFIEYPKWVNGVLCNDAAAEAAASGP